MKQCIACAEGIPTEAKLCRHCNSYQDWRRYFSFSQVVLTLLVALIAAATPLVIAIDNALEVEPVPRPNLTASYEDGSFRMMHLMVTNEGDRAGTVSDGIITIDGLNFALASSTSGPTLIPPMGTALVTYIISEPEFEYTNPHPNQNCVVTLLGSDSEDGLLDQVTIDCQVLQLITFPSQEPIEPPAPQVQGG